jgi:hypothetical protein
MGPSRFISQHTNHYTTKVTDVYLRGITTYKDKPLSDNCKLEKRKGEGIMHSNKRKMHIIIIINSYTVWILRHVPIQKYF